MVLSLGFPHLPDRLHRFSRVRVQQKLQICSDRESQLLVAVLVVAVVIVVVVIVVVVVVYTMNLPFHEKLGSGHSNIDLMTGSLNFFRKLHLRVKKITIVPL